MSGARLFLVFEDAEALVEASRTLRGLPGLDAHTPYHLPELSDALALPGAPIRPLMLVAGSVGALAMLVLQWWDRALRFPMNSGGRPPAPWPAYGFAVFEVAVLAAAMAGFIAFLVRARLTRLHDPFFATELTERASDDRFYLSLPAPSGARREELARLPGVIDVFEEPA
ncbi:MAG: DUF3341 domain-containing protein [Burkholderiaceae bacterium]